MSLFPVFDKDLSSTKDKILMIVASNPGLSTKKINNYLKKQYALNVTYQAVHKTLKQMMDQGILEFDGKSYEISEHWVDAINKFLDKIKSEQYSEIEDPIQISSTTKVYQLKNLHEMEKIYLRERDEFFSKCEKYPKNERYICVHAPHQYFSLMSAQLEYDYMDKLVKTGTTHYSLVKGDSVVDKWIKKFYTSKTGSPYKVLIGANCSAINEIVIYPELMIEIYYSEKFWKFYNTLYESVDNFEDINITKIMDRLYDLKDEPIKMVFHTDPNVIKLAREETLSLFNGKPEKKRNEFEIDNIEDLWTISLKFLYDDRYIPGLIKFLKKYKIKKILDCACGVGFPAIELKKNGFDVFCTDASSSMLKVFNENCKKNNVDIGYKKLDWRELDQLKDKYDLVMNRGNSLVYVDSWEKYFDQKSAIDNIKLSLQKMYNVIKPNGLLYVDMTSKEEYKKGPELVEKFGSKKIEGVPTELTWSVYHDWDHRKRRVKSIRVQGERKLDYDYYSFLLKHEELIKLLKEVGFKSVESIKIDGEEGYDVYLAKK